MNDDAMNNTSVSNRTLLGRGKWSAPIGMSLKSRSLETGLRRSGILGGKAVWLPRLLLALMLAWGGYAPAEPAGLLPPKVELLSTSISTAIGSSVMLMANTSGTPPWSFQWRMNGAEIPGATNSTLSLARIQLDNAGNYTFVLSNAVGAVTSQVARLIVRAPVNEAAPELTPSPNGPRMSPP